MAHRGIRLPLACLLLAASGSSFAPPTPAAPPTPTIAPLPEPTPRPTVPPLVGGTQIKGRVLDEDGAPITGVRISLTHTPGNASIPYSFCRSPRAECFLDTRTDANGDYTAELVALPNPNYPGHIGYVQAVFDGYQSTIQLVPAGGPVITRDLRLRWRRAIWAGESLTLTIDADSSRCYDPEMPRIWPSRCESFHVTTRSAGTLVITAAGSRPPEFHFGWSRGHTTGPPGRSESGTLSLPVVAGDFFILIGVPDGLPPQRFDVVTSLR